VYILKIVDDNKFIVFCCLQIVVKLGVGKRKCLFDNDISMTDIGIDNFDIFIFKADRNIPIQGYSPISVYSLWKVRVKIYKLF
jgi:hypothetical protein